MSLLRHRETQGAEWGEGTTELPISAHLADTVSVNSAAISSQLPLTLNLQLVSGQTFTTHEWQQ